MELRISVDLIFLINLILNSRNLMNLQRMTTQISVIFYCQHNSTYSLNKSLEKVFKLNWTCDCAYMEYRLKHIQCNALLQMCEHGTVYNVLKVLRNILVVHTVDRSILPKVNISWTTSVHLLRWSNGKQQQHPKWVPWLQSCGDPLLGRV